MKRGVILFSLLVMLAVSARCQTAMIALDDIPGTTLVCVTNYGPVIAVVTGRVAAVEGYTNNVIALSGGVTATNALFAAWFAGLFSETNKWMAAYGWGNWAGPVASNTAAILVLQTNTLTKADGLAYVTKEAFSTNQVTRWHDPELSTRWAEWDGGTNIVIYRAEISGTNFTVTLSDDFLETTGNTRPAWTNNAWPFIVGTWQGTTIEPGESVNFIISYGSSAGWASGEQTTSIDYPVLILPNSGASQGTATVSIASFNLTTNVEYRYFLPTNAIPPELANLDNLQGWLNNLYATRQQVDALTNAPTFLIYSNIVSAVTVTNLAERPVRIYGTGANTGLVSFAGLREPLPMFFEASRFLDMRFPGAYVTGGGSWQTNMVNLFIAFRSGTNDFVTPITTREP